MVQILQDRQTDRHTDNDRLSQLVCTFPKNALLHYLLGDIEPFTEVFDPDICQYVHLCRAEENTLAALGKHGGGAQGVGLSYLSIKQAERPKSLWRRQALCWLLW